MGCPTAVTPSSRSVFFSQRAGHGEPLFVPARTSARRASCYAAERSALRRLAHGCPNVVIAVNRTREGQNSVQQRPAGPGGPILAAPPLTP